MQQDSIKPPSFILFLNADSSFAIKLFYFYHSLTVYLNLTSTVYKLLTAHSGAYFSDLIVTQVNKSIHKSNDAVHE